MYLLLSTLAILLTQICGSIPTRGPPLAQVEVEKVVVGVGEDVKIVCPVEGNPAPIINWHMDDEVIDYTWTRMKTVKKVLKIKNVQKKDTGVLLCKAINGFGSVQVRIELIVIDAANNRLRQKDGSGVALAAPVLTKKTLSSRTLYKKLPGDSFLLNCSALGSPQPSLAWIHDGVAISSSPTLHIASLTPADSGTYTCVASNLVGRVAKEFSLTVSSPLVEVPVISDISNVSVREGETGVVQCSVSSSVPAQVKWLREVDHGEDFTVSVGNLRLVVVESGQLSLGDGLYISNLVIQNVHANNQGLYVCFATNTAGGFNYKTATLTVTVNAEETDQMEESTLILALVIGLAAVVLVLLVVLIVCVLKAKRKSLLPESPESVRTLMPCTPALPHQTLTPALPHQTLTIHTNYLDFSYDKNDHLSSGSLISDKNQHLLLQTDRSPESNHYEVPFSHLTYWHSKDSTMDKEVPNHLRYPVHLQPEDKEASNHQRYPVHLLQEDKEAGNHLRYPIHLQKSPWHSQDKLKPQSPLANTKYQTYKIENRSCSPASQKSQLKHYPPFQYTSVTEYQNY